MEFVFTFLSGLALIIIAFNIWGKDKNKKYIKGE